MSKGKFYTKDYVGETISQNVSWKNRNDPDSMIWVEKKIFNEDHHGVAHIIGNSKSRENFNLNLLKGQTGGELGVRSVGQTYGCNLLYKQFSPDFLICTNKLICNEIAESGYGKENIVFSNVKNILQHGGNFHLYPHYVNQNTGTLALKLACADGHKKIFLIGMTTYSSPEDNIFYDKHDAYKKVNVEGANGKFVQDCARIFLLYDDVEFFYVCEYQGLMPEAYNWIPNLKEITVPQYYNLASLGAIHYA
tara:strand:- start:6434 stop:7183 length:750 start_codon:yes stop_codon:yes gene_type:complete